MPIVRPCLSCSRLISGGSRCPECARAYQVRRDQLRGTPSERGYDADWRKVRRAVLERDGHVCHWCGEYANQADHLIPLSRLGERLDPNNVVASCGSCNAARGGATGIHR
jgi:5-methylcytosine-specific restriction endonuclease McrA